MDNNEHEHPEGEELENSLNAHDGALPTLGEMPNEDGDYSEEPPKFKGGTKSNVNKLFILLGVLVGLGGLFVGGLLLKKNFSKTEKPPAPVSVVKTTVAEDTKSLDHRKQELQAEAAKKDAEAAAEAAAELQGTAAAQPGTNAANAGTGQIPAQTSAEAEVEMREKRRMSGEVAINKGGADSAASRPAPAQVSAGGSSSLFGGGSNNSNGGFAAKLEPAVLTPRLAGTLPNTNYLLRQGTLIQCALITEIDTTLAGMTTCSVTQDIYSADGKVLLIERGSKINGQQTSALVQGQARVFVLWTRIDTPHGVTMNIDSPAAGQLGAAGIAGYVDTHFWERFGGAIMLSTIKDLSAIIVAKNSPQNGRGNNFENSQEAAEQMATKALENSINIPPTARVNAATVVNVMVARDVSFEGVYKVVK